MSAQQTIYEAGGKLREAQTLIGKLQEKCLPMGDSITDLTALWQQLEAIDDCIFEALSKLGE